MSSRPTVAQVLFIAAPSRQRELAPHLRADGLSVDYALDLVTPRELPETLRWDVVVIDGESLVDARERARVLRIAAAGGFVTTLYVCSRLPFEDEMEQALGCADDFVYPGWAFPERVARRVQAIALAPWRRSMALRMRAERDGDPKLRVLSPAEPAAAPPRTPMRLDRALPFVLAERAWRIGGQTPEMVARAFHEGRRLGVAAVKDRAEQLCDTLADELERGLRALSPEVVEELERDAIEDEAFASPVIAARYRTGLGVLETVRASMASLVRDELSAIERHRAPAEEVERW